MNLFVYGTLLVPPIWEAVTGINGLTGRDGSIAGHQIFRVQGGDFPGIVRTGEKEDKIAGKVFCDLPEKAVKRLDAYEGTLYERQEVTVELDDRTSIAAQTYVIPEKKAPEILSATPWTLDWFEENALDSYWARFFGS